MQRVGARDRPLGTGVVLTMLESATLDIILRAFIRGFNDLEVRKEAAARGMTASDRSLRGIYQIAEEAERSRSELQKLEEEERRLNELSAYKQLACQNQTKQQVDSFLSSYHSSKKHPQFTIAVDPGLTQDAMPIPSLPPPYRSEDARPENARPPLTQNPSKANIDAGQSSGYQGPRFRGKQAGQAPKDMPDRSNSQNPFINGSKSWSMSGDGVLCVKCGHLGHISKECHDQVLPPWEQAYLKEIVFGQSAQVNFASLSLGEYDSNTRPYGSHPSTTSSPGVLTPASSEASGAYMNGALSSPSSHSVSFGFAGLVEPPQLPQSTSVDAFLGEGSGPYKRAHIDESVQQPQQQQPQSGQQPYQFQAADDRPKRKGQKKVGKRTEPQPLVGLFDDKLGKYDLPVSVRQVLQNTKVDMSLMDLMAWSPMFVRDLKRNGTRVSKKRVAKGKQRAEAAPVPQPASQPNPFAQFNPAFPLGQQQLGQQLTQPMSQRFAPIPQAPFPQTFLPVMQPVVPPVQQPQVDPNQYPQFLQQQQPQLSQQQGDQNNQNTRTSAGTISSLATENAERHTRFLSTTLGQDKAFCLPCTIHKPNSWLRWQAWYLIRIKAARWAPDSWHFSWRPP